MPYKLEYALKINALGVVSDPIGNLYVFNEKQLFKYSPQMVLQNTFSNKLLGGIYSVDATNPLRILVFYKNNGLVQVLDNMLAPAAPVIDLMQDLAAPPGAVCSSSNGGMWVYFTSAAELVRYDAQFKPMVRTGNLIPVTGFSMNPSQILEDNNLLYLTDPEKGIFVFDLFGTWVKRLPFPEAEFTSVSENKIRFLKEGYLFEYNSLTTSLDSFPFKPEPFIYACLDNISKIKIVTGDSVKIFSSQP